MTIDSGDLEQQDEEDLTEVLNPHLREEIKEARRTKRELAKVQAELTAERGERLMTDAGVPSTGAGKYFRQGYGGEMSVDAIRKAAMEDGIIAPPPDAEADAQRAADLETARRIAGGVREGGEPQPDPYVELQSKIKGAKTRDDVLALVTEAQRSGVPGIRVPIQGEES